MSSRSIGVTNVWLRRWMMLWVRPSHSDSICLICSAVSQAGGSDASIRSRSVAPDTIRSARVMKSAKNFSSRGIRRKRTPEVCHTIVTLALHPRSFHGFNPAVIWPIRPAATFACMKALRILLVVFAFTAMPLAAAAQQTESRITGRVLDPSQAALPGVTVTVTSKATAAVRSDVTGIDGNYSITNLAPGVYEVRIELSGFAPKTRDVVLGVGQSEKVEVALSVAAVQEQV